MRSYTVVEVSWIPTCRDISVMEPFRSLPAVEYAVNAASGVVLLGQSLI